MRPVFRHVRPVEAESGLRDRQKTIRDEKAGEILNQKKEVVEIPGGCPRIKKKRSPSSSLLSFHPRSLTHPPCPLLIDIIANIVIVVIMFSFF